MNEQTRFRIMGGVFLASLLVISAPMLFDGAGLEALPPPPLPSAAAVVAPHVEALQAEDLAPAQALRDRIDEEGFDQSSAAKVGDPVLVPADRTQKATANAWGVQLGSFSDRAKAVALRDRLRGDGYPSLLTEVKGLTGVATRVAVGPLIDRDDATRLEREIEKRYGMDVIVVNFGQ
jgi:DedD protein